MSTYLIQNSSQPKWPILFFYYLNDETKTLKYTVWKYLLHSLSFQVPTLSQITIKVFVFLFSFKSIFFSIVINRKHKWKIYLNIWPYIDHKTYKHSKCIVTRKTIKYLWKSDLQIWRGGYGWLTKKKTNCVSIHDDFIL